MIVNTLNSTGMGDAGVAEAGLRAVASVLHLNDRNRNSFAEAGGCDGLCASCVFFSFIVRKVCEEMNVVFFL